MCLNLNLWKRLCLKMKIDISHFEKDYADSDWDGNNAQALSPSTVINAQKYLNLLMDIGGPPPTWIVPSKIDTIIMGWKLGRDEYHEIEIDKFGKIEMMHECGLEYDHEEFQLNGREIIKVEKV